ncbi:MAG: bifunctional hydroxymethylpyrimidine kinase/phosphomethylpyrimidine kinase [Candidatus Thermoplasmatota archaeon]|nr:bifunctional hydroxymethylpyrimidine kinase/phosphomethylpyrimidine kinase [Candidatus Thermoplasmatota archaeon]
MPPPSALTIAGSDSSGGAGIQADLKAMAATGVHGASAITCVTSQATTGLSRIDPLPPEAILEQIDQVLADLDVRAVKTGMLHTPQVVELVAERLAGEELVLVVDPVMVATSGDALSTGELPAALDKLARVATLITPNVDELELLTGVEIGDDEALALKAGRELVAQGWNAVLVKGGHLGGEQATDILLTAGSEERFSFPRAPGPFHGAGCTYASLIAGLMAHGQELVPAVREARARMHRAIQRAYPAGQGPRVLDVLEQAVASEPEGQQLAAAAWTLSARLPARLVPEVGLNLAHASGEAATPADVLGLAHRMTRTPQGPTPPGPVVLGGSGHVARVLLAARDHHPEIKAAMNLAYHEDHVAAARKAGLKLASFDRADEPPQAGSSMEWGTHHALAHTPGAQVIVDEGGIGKEPMMRLIATDPQALVTMVDALLAEIALDA